MELIDFLQAQNRFIDALEETPAASLQFFKDCNNLLIDELKVIGKKPIFFSHNLTVRLLKNGLVPGNKSGSCYQVLKKNYNGNDIPNADITIDENPGSSNYGRIWLSSLPNAAMQYTRFFDSEEQITDQVLQDFIAKVNTYQN